MIYNLCFRTAPELWQQGDLCQTKGALRLFRTSELRKCVKVEVAVLGFPSLMVSVDVKHHVSELVGVLRPVNRCGYIRAK